MGGIDEMNEYVNGTISELMELCKGTPIEGSLLFGELRKINGENIIPMSQIGKYSEIQPLYINVDRCIVEGIVSKNFEPELIWLQFADKIKKSDIKSDIKINENPKWFDVKFYEMF